MSRTKILALAWLVGGGLTVATPAARADDKGDRKDRVEDRADEAKDRIEDKTKAEKKAVDQRAEARKDALDHKADQQKAAVDSHANAEKAAIEHDANRTTADRDRDRDMAGRTADRSSDKSGAKEEVSDSWITTKIKSRIASEKALKGSDISVDTEKNGEVTLTGTAPSKKASQRAFQLASSTKGVRAVNNQVVISADK